MPDKKKSYQFFISFGFKYFGLIFQLRSDKSNFEILTAGGGGVSWGW